MSRSGITRPPRRPEGWVPPGPKPAGAQGREDLEPREGEDLCYLSGEWRLFQQVHGHRWSVDDLVTAWVAARQGEARHAATHLDLGTGLGSVLLMVAWRLTEVRSVGLEAQPAKAALARRSIAWNGVDARCAVVDGNLKDPSTLAPGARFDLVTGTPPYFPVGSGPESASATIAESRFERLGGLEDYLDAGARWLAPTGRLVVETNTLVADRVAPAAERAGLRHLEHLDVVPREGKAVLLCVDVFEPGPPATPVAATVVVRDASGQWTPQFSALRAEMGLPPSPPGRR